MKIHGNKPPDGQEINLNTQKVSRAQAQNEIAKSDKTKSLDTVEISAQGKKIAELMSAAEQLPAMRAEKIKAMKEALRSGAYQIDSTKIAQKLLEEV